MRRSDVFFHPMEGSGQLSISWSSAPKGAAVEAKQGNGVGFFSANGDLLSVIFDDVSAVKDNQILEFKKYKIEISVRNGIVKHKVTQLKPRKINTTAQKKTRSILKHHRLKIKGKNSVV